jgi:hypothetical protein
MKNLSTLKELMGFEAQSIGARWKVLLVRRVLVIKFRI